ncbi:MAG TPA: response regulator [Pyrinomonadaceae bacterium]
MRTPYDGKVLIAEDNDDVGLMLQCMLKSEGIAADLVGNGEQALEAISKERPDVLVTDIFMPIKDGLDLIKEVRDQEAASGGHNLPIIAMSNAGQEKLSKALRAGAAYALDKINFLGVIEKIKQTLRERSVSPPLASAVSFT